LLVSEPEVNFELPYSWSVCEGRLSILHATSSETMPMDTESSESAYLATEETWAKLSQ
jgi:hypothetical protein